MHKKNVNDSQNQAPVHMERKAIDGSGHLGSFYDGYSDCIVGQINMDDKGQVEQKDDPVNCEIIHGNADKTQNLLHMVGFEDDLGLNVLLGIAPRTRTAFIINHPFPINQHSRFIHYSYEHQKTYLSRDVAEFQKIIGPFQPRTTTTHIITSVHYGIEAVIALQLSSDDVNMNQIDDALRRVREILHDNSDTSCLSSYDENLFQQSTKILVYSNISVLNGMISMHDICQFLKERNGNEIFFQPLAYTLTPIHLIYPQFTGSGLKFIQLESTYQNKLEQSLLQSLNVLKDLKYSLDFRVARLLCGHLEEQLSKLQEQWVNLKNMQENHIKRLGKLVAAIRHGQGDTSKIDKALSDENQVIFYKSIYRMTQDLHELEVKGQLITDLAQEHFQYCNVIDYEIGEDDNEISIERKLISNNQNAQVLCSNDILNKNHPQQFYTLRKNLVKKRDEHSEVQLIYADFSYSSFKLKNMLILPSSRYENEENKTNKSETSSSKEISMASLNSDMINILLLGETGVGKSTFINAFANYLTFNTMQQAETNQAVVLIPVSFLITVGDDFEEHIVKFGDADDSNNEDFEHPGQSVTQHCRSYVFNVDHNHGKKVCIIDTPGFGDTRGIDQDDYNMTHILEYIKNLSHLDAICFLLKPNESRLNIFFRSCFVQLFSLLGSNIADNILFCFTNSRSTFYTPGNTAPLLKKMLASLSQSAVPFKKDNTFCFDSESFRYLVALRNKVPFSALERKEYEASWLNSVTQSKRLMDCIHTKLNAYRIDGNLHSVKHAQLEILHMIRPILEAMRNILRNRIIHTMRYSNETFQMHPRAISDPTSICISCKPNPLQVVHFWIAHNVPHEIQNGCINCRCPLDQHRPIDYVLEYECSNNSLEYDHRRMDDLLHELCQASVVFAHFLTSTNGSSKDEPFFTDLMQMITEEKYLCDTKKPNDLNLRLVNDLRELQTEYDKRMNSITCNQISSTLADIYQLINTIREYPMVHEQIIAAKEGQQMIMKQYEYEISENIIHVSNPNPSP